jgi:hypothetical protein
VSAIPDITITEVSTIMSPRTLAVTAANGTVTWGGPYSIRKKKYVYYDNIHFKAVRTKIIKYSKDLAAVT